MMFVMHAPGVISARAARNQFSDGAAMGQTSVRTVKHEASRRVVRDSSRSMTSTQQQDRTS